MVALRWDERPSCFQASRRTPDTASKQGTETTFKQMPAPSVIVEGAYVTTSPDTEYDVWGSRFLLMKDFTADGVRPGREIVVVQNWLGELGRLVPLQRR